MCELFAMSSRGPATVTLSLSILAEHGGKTALHKDGWGIAFYDEEDARILKDTTCASRSKWVKFVEQQELRSTLVISHIRLATDGAIAIKNTQPFGREMGGRMHVFAHNGHVPGIKSLGRFRNDSFRPIGDTDSEIAFCALLERIKPLWHDRDMAPGVQPRLDVVADFASDLGQFGPANFLYCDGEVLFAETSGVSVISPDQHVILVASVPLTTEAWEPFREGEVVAIANGKVAASVAAGDSALVCK